MEQCNDYKRGFIPYALAALLIGLVGGFSTVLGPAFVQDLELPYSSTTWTALAQAMSTAACAPILGKLGDVLGRRTALLGGIALFALGNVLSALANSLLFMLAARFVVGVGSAAMTPVIVAYIVTRFPPQKTAAGFSLYMLISSASVIAGPTLGGIILAAYGWRSMLWVCAALCGAVLAACVVLSRREQTPPQKPEDFDTPGAALVLVFFSLVLCIPSFGQNFGWRSVPFIAVLIAAALSFVLLLLAERRALRPILPGGFMARRTFVFSVIALFLTQGLMQANMTNTIVFVSYTQPGNSLISGYAISVMYLGMSLGAALLGPLADRLPPKRVLVCSLLLTGGGCALFLLFSEYSAPLLLMGALGMLGFGLGGNGTILMKAALAGLSPGEAGAGSGTYGLFRDLAAPFGVAVFVPFFTNKTAALTALGIPAAQAAVQSIHALALAELLCIIGGIAAVLCLPGQRS